MMTNTQLYLAIGLPITAVLTSLVISLLQISAIREDMRGQRSDLKDSLKEIRDDMRDLRADMKLLTGKVYELMGEKH